MKSEITFDHVLIVVNNLEHSIEFYTHLGFQHIETIQRPNDSVGVMQLDNIKIELMCQTEGKETHRTPRIVTDLGFRHIGLRVKDVEAVYEKLKNVIEFDSMPKPIVGRKNRMTVFFKDPDGVELHFVQQ